MPLIKASEDRKIAVFTVLRWSSLLIAASFVTVLVSGHAATLWIGMAILTFGEMLNFPYMNRFVYDRDDQGRPGAYMGAFTSTWSIAHVLGHSVGLNLIDLVGFDSTWFICVAIVLVGMISLSLAERQLKSEETEEAFSASSPITS